MPACLVEPDSELLCDSLAPHAMLIAAMLIAQIVFIRCSCGEWVQGACQPRGNGGPGRQRLQHGETEQRRTNRTENYLLLSFASVPPFLRVDPVGSVRSVVSAW